MDVSRLLYIRVPAAGWMCVPTTAPAGPARASTAARPRAASGIGPSGQASSDDEPSPVRVAVGGALEIP